MQSRLKKQNYKGRINSDCEERESQARGVYLIDDTSRARGRTRQ